MGTEVGSAFLQVVPSFSGAINSITSEYTKYGQQAGDVFSKVFNETVKEETGNPSFGPSDEDSTEKGSSSGGKFADAFKARLDAALKSLPDVKINADNSDIDAKIAFIRAELDSLNKKEIGVDITDDEALAKLAYLKSVLEAINHSSESIQIKVDTGAAITEIAGLETAVKAVSDGGGNGGSSGGGLGGLFDSIGEDAAGAGSAISSSLLPAIALLSTALVPLTGLALGGLATLPAIFAGMASGIGAVVLGSSGLGTALSAMNTVIVNPNWTNIAAVETALKALAPAAASFVTGLEPIIKGFQQLQNLTQQDLFLGLNAALPGLEKLFVGISPFILMAATDIGQFATSVVGILSSKSGLSDMNTIFKAGAGFMQDLSDAVLNAIPAFLTIGKQASPILDAIGNGIQNLVAAFARWVQGGGFEKFMTWLKDNGPGIVKDISSFVSGFAHLLVALAPVGVLALQIIKWLGQLANVLGQGITNDLKYLETHWLSAWNDIKNFFVGIWHDINNTLLAMHNAFINFFAHDIPEAASVFSAAITGAFQAVHNIVNTVWHAIDNDVFIPFENFFTQTIPHALSVFFGAMTTGFQAVHDIVNTIWHAIDNDVFDPIYNFFTQTIPSALSGFASFFTNAFQSAHDLVNKIWGDMQNDFLNPLVDFFTKTIPNAASTFASDFINAWNSVLTPVENVINDIISAYNAIPILGNVGLIVTPAQSAAANRAATVIGTLGDLLPHAAAGGPISGPTLVGELGPEIFVPNGPGRIIPHSQITAPSPSGLSGGSNAPLQHVEEQNFYSAVDLQQLDSQLASMRRGQRL